MLGTPFQKIYLSIERLPSACESCFAAIGRAMEGIKLQSYCLTLYAGGQIA